MSTYKLFEGFHLFLKDYLIKHNYTANSFWEMIEKNEPGALTIKTLNDLLSSDSAKKRRQEKTMIGLSFGLKIQPVSSFISFVETYADRKPISLQKLNQIDENIIEILQNFVENCPTPFFEKVYWQTLEAEFKREFITINAFLKNSYIKEYIEEISEKDKIIIEVAENLNLIQYGYKDIFINIKNPELLWNCNCDVPYSDSNLCPMHLNNNADLIKIAFANSYAEIRWKGFSYLWKNGNNLWPPSFDSFYFVDNITKEFMDKNIKSVLDVGSGTGFLGFEVLRNLDTVIDCATVDFTLYSYLFSSINFKLNEGKLRKQKGTITHRNLLGYNIYFDQYFPEIKEMEFDLLICNPPYIPIPDEFVELRRYYAVAGIELLKFILKNGNRYAENVVVNFSDICLPEVKEFLKDSPIQIVEFGQFHEVPFRIPRIMNNSSYFNKFLFPRLKMRNDSSFPFYHIIRSYRIINDSTIQNYF